MCSSSYETFEQKLKEWRASFNSGDPNCIVYQIYRMTDDTAVYKMINEGRKYADKDESGDLLNSGYLHQWIDYHFLVSQSLIIRRLATDDRPDVNSLPRLIKDMKKHRHLFTRSNIYKYNQMGNRVISSANLQMINRYLDGKYINVGPHEHLGAELFQTLTQELIKCANKFKIYSDKYFAHAANTTSRDKVNADKTKIKYGELSHAQKIIIKTASIISNHLLFFGGISFFLSHQGSITENMDVPIVPTEHLSDAQSVFDEYKRWIDEASRVFGRKENGE